MRKYETVFISDPDLQDQVKSDLYEKVRNIITKEDGLVLDFDEWGNKKLAYEIKKKSRGHYVCVTYGGTGALVTELERNFRLTDDVLKFMTIVLSEDMTKEALEKEAQDIQDAASAEAAAPAEEAAEAKAPEADAPAETQEAAAPEAEQEAAPVAEEDVQKEKETE